MKKLTSVILCIALVLSMAACDSSGAAPTTVPHATIAPTQPVPTPEELYANAVAKTKELTSQTLTIKHEREMTVGADTFEQTIKQTLTLQNMGTDSFAAQLKESKDSGTYDTKTTEIYTDGTLYGQINEDYFIAELTQEEYLARFAPAVALDASLYGSILQESETSFEFSAPTSLEAWVANESAVLVDASGTVDLDETGIISKSTYTATYSQGPAKITDTITVQVKESAGEEIAAPSSTALYLPLEHYEIPELLHNAIGYAMQAGSITTTKVDTMFSAASGVAYSIQSTHNAHGYGMDICAKIENSYQLVDYNNSANSFDYDVENLYQNGKYTMRIDDGEAESDPRVTSNDMRNAVKNNVVSLMMPITYLKSITIKDLGSNYLLEFEMNEDGAKSTSHSVTTTLYNDPDLLDDLASDYRTEAATGYLSIDKITGLPTAAGLEYLGYHTIEDTECALACESTQSIYLGSLSAYETVTGEPFPVDEPSQKATPLLYHVTGPDGNELWLFGTIHVGDARTAYLPQEIYDAFSASDALAVEFDTDAFEEQSKTDEELIAAIAQAYFYTDGTTTADHIQDAALYETAEALMKATGNYTSNVKMMRPYFWSQVIDNYYLQQNYSLTSSYGMDSQLLKLAREQDKEILDVESGEFQVQMLADFSDELQETLLRESVESAMQDYNAEVQNLFELWCQGNEAALIEVIRDDLSDSTEEELALYEEYNTAVSTDRNAGMLKVALDYLASGDTVFYAVGLAHLLTEDGLVFALQNAGYTVELVTYK